MIKLGTLLVFLFATSSCVTREEPGDILFSAYIVSLKKETPPPAETKPTGKKQTVKLCAKGFIYLERAGRVPLNELLNMAHERFKADYLYWVTYQTGIEDSHPCYYLTFVPS